jgi:O-antigen biosynthesis protein
LQQAIAFTGQPHAILVVDDGGSDDTPRFIREQFPQVEVLSLEHCGFSRAINSGVLQAKTDTVILLNNDIVVEPEFIGALLAPLQDSGVFGVGAKTLSETGELEFVLGNLTRGLWRQGLLEIFHETNPMRLHLPAPQLYAQGSALACRRRHFLDLGGFDTLYEPFYWEDVDLCYRAWKRGWKVLYEPKAVCRHFQSRTTARDYAPDFVRLCSLRNAYLFLWKNITDKPFFFRHLAGIPRRVARDIMLGAGGLEYRALSAALSRLREAAAKRVLERSFAVISDKEVLKRSGSN